MLKAFVDDSGSSDTDAAFVLAGFLVSPEGSVNLSYEWQSILSGPPPIRYFKAAEARSLKGEFSQGWTAPLIDQCTLSLAEVIARHALLRVRCVMLRADYNRYLREFGEALRSPFDLSYRSPYMSLFFGLMLAVRSFLRRHDVDQEIEYYFDDQGAFGKFSASVFDQIRDETLKNLMPISPVFADDKRLLPLQAADLCAWNEHDHIMNYPLGTERSRHVKQVLARLGSIDLVMDARYLEPMRETLWQAAAEAPQFLRA